MKIKTGVTVKGLQAEALFAMLIVEKVYADMGFDHVITSITDGNHMEGSLHYSGFAFDNRTWADEKGTQLSDKDRYNLAAALRKALGPEFDVVPESTHIHVEFDPS